MSRILITWELGTSPEHWSNLRPIAERLVISGHEVFAALREVNVICNRWPQQLPLRLLQAPYLLTPASLRIPDERSLAHIFHNSGYHRVETLEATVRAWRQLYEMVQPDVILFCNSPTALLAARGLKCARVNVGAGFSFPPNSFPLPDLQPWRPSIEEQLQQNELKVLILINKVLTRIKAPELPRIAELFHELDENFLLTFPELDHYGSRQGVNYWGAWSPIGENPPNWLRESEKYRIFVHLDYSNHLHSLLSQLSADEFDVIVYLSFTREDVQSLNNAGRIRVHTAPIDYCSLARNCDLAILNADTAVAANILLQGVPVLNLPSRLDQTLSSHRMVEGGLGEICRVDRPDTFMQKVERTLNAARIRKAARAFSQRYAAYDSQKCLITTIERIEQLSQKKM